MCAWGGYAAGPSSAASVVGEGWVPLTLGACCCPFARSLNQTCCMVACALASDDIAFSLFWAEPGAFWSMSTSANPGNDICAASQPRSWVQSLSVHQSQPNKRSLITKPVTPRHLLSAMARFPALLFQSKGIMCPFSLSTHNSYQTRCCSAPNDTWRGRKHMPYGKVIQASHNSSCRRVFWAVLTTPSKPWKRIFRLISVEA